MSAAPQDGPRNNDVVSKSTLSIGVIVGTSIGIAIGILLTVSVVAICIRSRRKHGGSEQREIAIPIRVHGVDSSTILSNIDTGVGKHLPPLSKRRKGFGFWQHNTDKNFIPGITKFSYKELQTATNNFTTRLGGGAFGSVYKATLPTTLAVKVLSPTSRQGKHEFQTEVSLLGRLHHRNLVSLVGYCIEREQCMLVYEYMSNGSLEKLLYDMETTPLSWVERVQIAKDISRGIEYLHDGAVPAVIHRDIKSANILLDSSMTARVADFGLSKEVTPAVPTSGIKGTYGYLDPEYMFTRTFTDKSDVYSFGVLLFEIISGRNPQQGLLDYAHLAAMGGDGSADWNELLDSRLNGNCNLEELGIMASIAYCCIRKSPSRRPNIRDVVQSLSTIGNKIKHSISEVGGKRCESLHL